MQSGAGFSWDEEFIFNETFLPMISLLIKTAADICILSFYCQSFNCKSWLGIQHCIDCPGPLRSICMVYTKPTIPSRPAALWVVQGLEQFKYSIWNSNEEWATNCLWNFWPLTDFFQWKLNHFRNKKCFHLRLAQCECNHEDFHMGFQSQKWIQCQR